MTFEVEPTLTGIHSRSEETVRISRDFDRGRAEEAALRKTFEKDGKDLVNTQVQSEFTRVSDGQIKWQDFIRPFSESLGGLKSGADLSRWFDTNTFYRRPAVTGRITVPKDSDFILKKYTISSAFDTIEQSKKKTSLKRKISLPGPYTLASLVDDKHYGDKLELTEEFAKSLGKVITSLEKAGIESFQINEPSLVYRYGESALTNKSHLKAFVSSFSENIKTKREIFLHTYFGDCSSILSDLLELPNVSAIGIDFTQTSLDDIEETKFNEKGLACGCVDGRNSLIESSEWIAEYCLEALKTLRPSKLFILPSSELKYLPRTYADEKIRSIGKAAKLVEKQLK